MNSVLIPRVRFACKLTFAILGALVLGFYLQLETPRWSAMTAAIVTSGPALAAGRTLCRCYSSSWFSACYRHFYRLYRGAGDRDCHRPRAGCYAVAVLHLGGRVHLVVIAGAY